VETFTQSYFTRGIEEDFAGLFCLLRIAKDPTTEVITDAAERMFNFIFSPKTDPEVSLFTTKIIYNRKILLMRSSSSTYSKP